MPAMSSNTTSPSSSTSSTPNFFCFLCYFFSSPLLANIPLQTSFFLFNFSFSSHHFLIQLDPAHRAVVLLLSAISTLSSPRSIHPLAPISCITLGNIVPFRLTPRFHFSSPPVASSLCLFHSSLNLLDAAKREGERRVKEANERVARCRREWTCFSLFLLV